MIVATASTRTGSGHAAQAWKWRRWSTAKSSSARAPGAAISGEPRRACPRSAPGAHARRVDIAPTHTADGAHRPSGQRVQAVAVLDLIENGSIGAVDASGP